MKKIITLILSVILLIGMTACGGSDSSSDKEKGSEAKVVKIENNIDATAEALDLSNGEETMYQLIGATAGKEYNSGEVELYQFDESSEAYKEIESSGTVSGIEVAAYKDGIALIFANETDQTIINEFNKIQYK